jgi:hypothetical protein
LIVPNHETTLLFYQNESTLALNKGETLPKQDWLAPLVLVFFIFPGTMSGCLWRGVER